MKKPIIIYAVVILVVIALIVTGILVIINRNKKIKSLEAEAVAMRETIAYYENTIPVYELIADRAAGTPFNEKDVVPAHLPAGTDLSIYITDLESIAGYHYITDLHAGNKLTTDLLIKDKPHPTDKYYDVYLDVLQLGVRPGSYIEINWIDPKGGKHTVFGKKYVHSVNGNLVTLTLSAVELSTLYGAYVDLYMTLGSTIESALYVQPSMQKATTSFYTPSPAVLRVMDIDPNMTAKVLEHITERNRSILVANTILGEDEIASIIEGRAQYMSALQAATSTKAAAAEQQAQEEEEYVEDYAGQEIIGGVSYPEENVEENQVTGEMIEGSW